MYDNLHNSNTLLIAFILNLGGITVLLQYTITLKAVMH